MRRSPTLTVDVVIFYEGGLVLVKRGREPFKGCWAIPGGVVEYGESVEQAAVREALEETGLSVELVDLVGVYSEPERDPRGHFVSVAFLARAIGGAPRASGDAASVAIFSEPPPNLAFDHSKILDDALRKASALGLWRKPTRDHAPSAPWGL
ncbi:MAG: NUDIX hydrolase [Candidatus Nezhaarchaeota archaeon]|nr:NUDIX hydrolase [Candidatus Nezhaarchaeota archaeon]